MAVTNLFYPVADTSLLEIAPNNNLGGFAGMNAGSTQEYNRTRALMRFDLNNLPTNTLVLSALVQLEVTRQPDEPPNNTTFSLHRMLRPWGEGNKSPVTQPGKGLPASPGEATWICAFHPTNTWTVPGGAPDVDYSSIASSSQFIYGIGESPYRFDTTPELVADVTSWLQHPANNFGWMLLCDSEFMNFTARRFSTREDLHFLAYASQTYVVEYRDALTTGNWQPLTEIPPFLQNTNILVVDTNPAPQRFYRLNTF